MIDGNTAVQLMRMELDRKPVKSKSRQGTQYAIRCPFCGDSKKDSRDTHFYIKTSSDNRMNIPLFPYDCKLCGVRRKIISVQDAIKIGIQNEDLLEFIGSLNKIQQNIMSRSGSNVIAKSLKNSSIPLPDAEKLITMKKEYLYNRLQDTDLSENYSRYKIVLDLVQFFIDNKLKPNYDYNNPKYLLRMMHENTLGFLSFDNTHLNSRDITGKMKTRYTQYMIYPESILKRGGVKLETSGMYIIPTVINTMRETLKLVMAEGSFDILRAFTDFYGHDVNHGIFTSVQNSHGYVPCLQKLMEYGMLFDEIDIYSDDDVDLSFYRQKVKPVVPNAKIRVYYNTKSKDIGDRTKPTQLSRVTL